MQRESRLDIVWHMSDLRVFDHMPLLEASSKGSVLGVYIHQVDASSAFSLWTQGAVRDLASYYESLGSSLLYYREPPSRVFKEILRELSASHKSPCSLHIHMHVPKSPIEKLAYESVKQIEANKIIFHFYDTNYLISSDAITNAEGAFIRVFTPFYKRFLQLSRPRLPHKAPSKLSLPSALVGALTPKLKEGVENISELPSWGEGSQWQQKLAAQSVPTRESAVKRLSAFKKQAHGYLEGRNDPNSHATSELSMYLACGLISPHEVYHQVEPLGAEGFIRQLVWREFAAYLLDHNPEMTLEPFSPKFSNFSWIEDPEGFEKWKNGETGYPFIDAAMRALWKTGWMHNRLRMVTGSFLVKDLLIDWKKGAEWFEHTLIDYDVANNTFGWQWVGGMGPDAAPFFRIFNPVLQSQKFDPNGAYIRKYVPELKALDSKYMHAPWEAPKEVLEQAGITLGKTYPFPIVDHKMASQRAKAVFQSL